MTKVFKSFEELAVSMGMKPNVKKVVKRKCGNCGGQMRNIAGTNVWVCDFNKLENQTMEDGTEVQVFTPCESVNF